MDRRDIGKVLETCEFFMGLDESNIDRIAGLCQVETYKPGEYVFRQGDFGEHLYVIAEGRIFLERAVDLGVAQGKSCNRNSRQGKGFWLLVYASG